ncbi:MAG: protein kinase [Pyrinomonadaceae bacterium]
MQNPDRPQLLKVNSGYEHLKDSIGQGLSNYQTQAEAYEQRWRLLCSTYLNVVHDGSIWRSNREAKYDEPAQGWKLHLSATILDACDLFERVAPVLNQYDVQYKAPNSLGELLKLNSGQHHGYHQVGKFITVYPRCDDLAVELAEILHELTSGFAKVVIPFDEQYKPDSALFYRYGGFARIHRTDESGKTLLLIKDPEGNEVEDDRRRAKPDWVSHIFPRFHSPDHDTFNGTPLGGNYRIFDAMKQRGKGGTYLAMDLTQARPRLAIVKEGRRHGEVAWNGQDGYALAQNEYAVLKQLRERYPEVPEARDAFEVNNNFYFVMEHIDGESLKQRMDRRRRRYSIKQIVDFAISISQMIRSIHSAGWIWNDCKPANLIITPDGKMRPIDFEGSYPIGTDDPFEWKTKAYSDARFDRSEGARGDIYAFGATLYFLLTGRLFEPEVKIPIRKLRRDVPRGLTMLTEKMLNAPSINIEIVISGLQDLYQPTKGLRTASFRQIADRHEVRQQSGH